MTTTVAALQAIIARGESETLEIKRSTAELKRGGDIFRAYSITEARHAALVTARCA